MAAQSLRLPATQRGGNYLRHGFNKVTGRKSVLEIELAGQKIKLQISSRREIKRAHAIHHEIDFVERIRAHLSSGDTIFDIGANIGVLTLLMAKHPNSVGSKLYSFEPEPKNFEQLDQNIVLNDLQDKVSPVQLALGVSEGEAVLHVRGTAGEGRHSIAESAGSTDDIAVPLATCSGFAARESVKPDVLKIDVEGAEGQVLAGMKEMLNTHAPREIFLEIHNKGDGDKMPDGISIHQWFEQNSYALAWNVERRSGEHRHYQFNAGHA